MCDYYRREDLREAMSTQAENGGLTLMNHPPFSMHSRAGQTVDPPRSQAPPVCFPRDHRFTSSLEHLVDLAASLFHVPAVVLRFQIEGQPDVVISSPGVHVSGAAPQAICRRVFDSRLPVVSSVFPHSGAPGLASYVHPAIRFYAGVPILGEDGQRIGVFFIYDAEPHGSFPLEQQQMLLTLASLASDAITSSHLRKRLFTIERGAKENEQFLKIAQLTAQSGFWRATLEPLAFALTEETCALYNLPFQPSFSAKEMLEQLHPEDAVATRKAFVHGMLSGCLYVEYRLLPRAHGAPRWLATRARLFHEAGGPPTFVGVSYDITSLKATEQRYLLASRATRDGLWDWDLHTDTVYYSPRWQSIVGFDEHEVCDTLEHWTGRIHDADRPGVEAELNAHLSSSTGVFTSEHRIRHVDGTWRWVKAQGLAERDAQGHPLRVAGSLSDITPRKMADPLTGLPNRLLVLDRLEQRIERGHHSGNWNFAVLSVHLDRFKLINDTLGYSGGDALLIEISQRLQFELIDPLTPRHTIARVGGGEFLVFLEDVSGEEEAFAAASTVKTALEPPFVYCGSDFSISASIGVVLAGPEYFHPEDLIRDADTAMHQARVSGCARSLSFNSTMREETVNRFQIEGELRHAMDDDQLMLYYQPEIDLSTHCIVGFEALVRWRHPERGILPPGEFISIAEESGLILPLGDWGLTAACQQILAWSALALSPVPLRVSVNLSAKQFARPGLVEQVASILATTGIDANLLCLEVTESSLMADADGALETMQRLRALGVGLHMDDFGTGYSSLQYLHRYPFDTLKIDRSFISRLNENKESSEIVRTILSLAQSLGMTVVAEGIETEEQLQCLKSLGCGFGQGYYFSRPLDVASIGKLFNTSRLIEPPANFRFHLVLAP
jgi:diguanylate cyclase (GGDEF)-like protein/PAS domain S-box-containing protein